MPGAVNVCFPIGDGATRRARPKVVLVENAPESWLLPFTWYGGAEHFVIANFVVQRFVVCVCATAGVICPDVINKPVVLPAGLLIHNSTIILEEKFIGFQRKLVVVTHSEPRSVSYGCLGMLNGVTQALLPFLAKMSPRWDVGVVEKPLLYLDGHMLVAICFVFAKELMGDEITNSSKNSSNCLCALLSWAVETLVMELGEFSLHRVPFLQL